MTPDEILTNVAFGKEHEAGNAVKHLSLGTSLLFSSLIHFLVLLSISILINSRGNVLKTDLVPVSVLDAPRMEKKARREAKPKLDIKPAPPQKSVVERETLEVERSASPPAMAAKEESAKAAAKTPAAPQPEQRATLSTVSRGEGGGSEPGAGDLLGKGDLAVLGNGTAAGAVGTANAGHGRDSGAPGLPAQTAILRTNREAKPMQTVRASYPPMALRLGMEGDVILRIEVDGEGKVTKAEITKSGGVGFDEEALKAVKQSRFEPAQRDGKNIPAEFTYIYRFRLAK